MAQPTIHYIRLDGWPIFKQLQLEEALMRADERNWCLINQGSEPSVVMGISGKPELLIDEDHHQKHRVPLIRRFSGGGTVYVDQNTLFVTFICNSEEFNVPCFPKEVMRWTENIYRPIFNDIDFQLRENDYVIGDRKFGGNAQYLQKKRWLHHSTLLWEYDPHRMNILKLPPKMPEYRKTRHHTDFLCSLKDHFKSRDDIVEGLLQSLSRNHKIKSTHIREAESILDLPHRKSTMVVANHRVK